MGGGYQEFTLLYQQCTWGLQAILKKTAQISE
jgi:hypothetical protein